jgi:hypothetical protein
MLIAEDMTGKIIEWIKKCRAMVDVLDSVYNLLQVKAILPITIMDLLCRVLVIATSSLNMTGRRDSIIFK